MLIDVHVRKTYERDEVVQIEVPDDFDLSGRTAYPELLDLADAGTVLQTEPVRLVARELIDLGELELPALSPYAPPVPEVNLAHDASTPTWNVFCSECEGPDDLPGIYASHRATDAAEQAEVHLAHHQLRHHLAPAASAQLVLSVAKAPASTRASAEFLLGVRTGALAVIGHSSTPDNPASRAVRTLVEYAAGNRP